MLSNQKKRFLKLKRHLAISFRNEPKDVRKAWVLVDIIIYKVMGSPILEINFISLYQYFDFAGKADA